MKSNNLKKFAGLISALFLLVAGCKKGDEYFVNPNSPTDATVQTLLTSLEVATMNGYEGDFARTAGILVQHNAGVEGQATQVHGYTLSENQYDNQWGQLYQSINTGYIFLNKAGTANPRYKGIGKIVLALNWGMLTDFWGDVPYSEAISDVKFPKYDSQESILNNIQTLLTEAISDLQSVDRDNLKIPKADDVIFQGNAAAWTKTAWTLKARYLNRLSKKTTYKPADILSALSKGIASATDDCMSIHGSSGTESNEWYAFLNQRAYLKAAKPFVDSISLRPADKRLSFYFDPTGGIKGSPIAVVDANASDWGSYLAGSDDTPAPLVTYFESLFIKAEVLARQGDASAATALNDAIKASCAKVTGGSFNGAAIANYTPATTNVSRVMYEKWIAMFGQCEVYHDYRRTGFPTITPNPQGATAGHIIPKRFPTPANERTANPNAPVPSILDPVWWAQ